MSITVRLWSKSDLEKIGKDPKLTTIFMNGTTFSGEEIKHYPYNKRRTFHVILDSMDVEDEPISVFATSPQMARWFVGQEYNGTIIQMDEIVTNVKPVRPFRGYSIKKARKKGAVSPSGMRGMR